MGTQCRELAILLGKWNFPVETITGGDLSTDCCEPSLVFSNTTMVVECTSLQQQQVIVALSLAGAGLTGPVPSELQNLSSLTYVDLSSNPGITGGLDVLASMVTLNTIILSGDSGLRGNTLPQFQASVSDCKFDGTGLCGDPGVPCQGALPLPLCHFGGSHDRVSSTIAIPSAIDGNISTTTTTPTAGSNEGSSNGNDYDFIAFHPSTVLWILISSVIVIFLFFTATCFYCNRRNNEGAKTKRLVMELERAQLSTASVDERRPLMPPLPLTPYELSQITLSRRGVPIRTFSLPDSLKPSNSLIYASSDYLGEEDIDPFLKANDPPASNEFPVRRGYNKLQRDEMILTVGDKVVLLKVFKDGWAEGVSMRNGGPARFPLACLGGGVLVVLARRLRADTPISVSVSSEFLITH